MNETVNGSAIFRRSTLRDGEVLISESLSHLPTIRIIMIIICILLGISTLVDLIVNHLKYRFIMKQTILHRRIIPILLLLNILFHVAHYTHNIYDPAAYFEKKGLYVKRMMTEMEQTFFFNFLVSIMFIIANRSLYASCTIGHNESVKMPILVTIYGLMSMISIGHYRDEPPWNFSWICNTTIAGETILAFLLIIVSWFIHRSNLNEVHSHAYNRLITDPNIQILKTKRREFKDKRSDQSAADEESP